VVEAGHVVAAKAEAVEETVVDSAKTAAAWGGHVAHQAASVLESRLKLPSAVKPKAKVAAAAAQATQKEGGVNESLKNSGDPNQVVDISSPQAIHQTLATLGQKDQVDDTDADFSRCQSNVILAGLLVKGGKTELRAGLDKARADAKGQLAGATGGKKAGLE